MTSKLKHLLSKLKCKLYGDNFITKEFLMDYINKEVGNEPFIFIMAIGPSQKGKSTFGNWLCKTKGVEPPFAVGESNKSVTVGCEIAYAGTVADILKKTRCTSEQFNSETLESKLHVFMVDTEGIQSTKSDDQIAAFVLPLIDVSAKLIYFSEIDPDVTKTKFLEMCQKISSIMGKKEMNNGKSMFDNKLIFRVKDYPKLVLEKKYDDEEEEENEEPPKYVPQYDLQTSIQKCLTSDIASFMQGQGTEQRGRTPIPIVFAPGGPGKPGDPYTKEFNQHLLQLIFSSINPDFIFTKNTFCQKFYYLADEYAKQKGLIIAYLHAFDFKEVDLNRKIDEICQNITDYFNEIKSSNSEGREIEFNPIKTFHDKYDQFVKELDFHNDKLITKGRNLIEHRYTMEKEVAKKKFEIIRTLRKKQNEAKNITEKRINSLKCLSDDITNEVSGAVSTFFQDFKKSYVKFSQKEEIRVNSNLKKSKINCIKSLNAQRKILQKDLSQKVDDDIEQMFQYLNDWKKWLPFQNSSRFMLFIARTFHNSDKDTEEKYIPRHPGMIGKFKKEWNDNEERCRGIIIENRKYDILLQELVIEISQKEKEEELKNENPNEIIEHLARAANGGNLLNTRTSQIDIDVQKSISDFT